MKKKVNIIWVIILVMIIVIQLVYIAVLKINIKDTISIEETTESTPDIITTNINAPQTTEQTIEEITYKQGIFSWEPGIIEEANRFEMYKVIDQLGINEVYQYFEDINADNVDAHMLAQELDEMDIDLYLLAGESTWTYKPDGAPMLEEINRAAELKNSWGDNLINGIVFDIEPYASDKWARGKEEILINNYISGMKAAYEAAREENIHIILCVPTWYDIYHNDLLIELINYSDEILVMNYGREKEYDNMIDEINYSRDLSKPIGCVFEFQAVGQYNLTNEQTYSNLGIEAAIESFENLYRKVNYSELKFVYHYLRPIQDLLDTE